jgi:multidrug efflux pump subunit AcrA (membrane-fusion protein)
MIKIISITLFAILSLAIYSCTPTKAASDKEELAKKSYVEKQVVEVTTQKVQQGTFARELVSNGFLMACNKAVVPFNVDENILDVFVSEGEQVHKGQKLAKVDPFSFDKKRKDADVKHQKALIDLDDFINNSAVQNRINNLVVAIFYNIILILNLLLCITNSN